MWTKGQEEAILSSKQYHLPVDIKAVEKNIKCEEGKGTENSRKEINIF